MWTSSSGRCSPAWALCVCRSPGGLVKAGPVLHRPGHPEVFVIGDLAPAEQDSIGLPMLAAVGATPGGDGSE